MKVIELGEWSRELVVDDLIRNRYQAEVIPWLTKRNLTYGVDYNSYLTHEPGRSNNTTRVIFFDNIDDKIIVEFMLTFC